VRHTAEGSEPVRAMLSVYLVEISARHLEIGQILASGDGAHQALLRSRSAANENVFCRVLPSRLSSAY
jgi:hypothetical protein